MMRCYVSRPGRHAFFHRETRGRGESTVEIDLWKQRKHKDLRNRYVETEEVCEERGEGPGGPEA